MERHVAIWTDAADIIEGDVNLWLLENRDNLPYAVVTEREYEAVIRQAFADGQGLTAELITASDYDALASRWETEALLRESGGGNGPKHEADKHVLAFRQAAKLQRAEDRRVEEHERQQKIEENQIA